MINFLKFSGLQYIVIGLSIIVNFFLAKYLSQEDYGIFSLGIVIYNIIYGLNNYGLERNGLVRLYDSINHNYEEEVISQIIIRKILLILLLSVFIIYYLPNPNFNILFWYIISGFIYSMIPRYFFDIKNKFIYESLISLADRIIYILFLLYAFIFSDLTNLYLGIAYLVGRLLYTILGFKIIDLKLSNVDWKIVLIKIKDLLKGNFVFWLATCSNVLLLYVNQLILGGDKGIESLAIFSFAMQFISLIRILQNQFLRWYSPLLSEKIANKTLEFLLIRKILTKSFLFSVLVSVSLYILASIIIKLYYIHYIKSIDILMVLCVWSFFYGPGIIVSFILSNRVSGNIFLIVSFLTAILSVFVGYIFQADALMLSIAIAFSHSIAMLFQFILMNLSYAKSRG